MFAQVDRGLAWSMRARMEGSTLAVIRNEELRMAMVPRTMLNSIAKCIAQLVRGAVLCMLAYSASYP
eukprot:3025499-Pleurochrysis_carterae.AAC.1